MSHSGDAKAMQGAVLLTICNGQPSVLLLHFKVITGGIVSTHVVVVAFLWMRLIVVWSRRRRVDFLALAGTLCGRGHIVVQGLRVRALQASDDVSIDSLATRHCSPRIDRLSGLSQTAHLAAGLCDLQIQPGILCREDSIGNFDAICGQDPVAVNDSSVS